MLRVTPHEVSTAHSPSAYPFAIPPPSDADGVVIGLDGLSGGVWSYDPFDSYARGEITSPSMLVLGAIGRGKSALVKTYLSRQVENFAPQVFVLDPKGEYAALARQLGLAHLALAPGGRQRINPLEYEGPERFSRRAEILEALAAVSIDRGLEPAERAALAVLAHDLPFDATLRDAVDALGDPNATLSAALRLPPDQAAATLRPLFLSLGRLTTGALAGMLDGASTAHLDPDGPGAVVDLSATFGSDAAAPVMACATAWLAQLISRADRHRILLVDEAWALLGRPATVSWLQSTSKLARTYGVQLILVTHRVSDLRAQADAGSSAAAQAIGLLADVDTHVVYGQPEAERGPAAELLGLTGPEVDLVCALPRHRAWWRVGSRVGVVDHLLAPGDEGYIDTDRAMTG